MDKTKLKPGEILEDTRIRLKELLPIVKERTLANEVVTEKIDAVKANLKLVDSKIIPKIQSYLDDVYAFQQLLDTNQSRFDEKVARLSENIELMVQYSNGTINTAPPLHEFEENPLLSHFNQLDSAMDILNVLLIKKALVKMSITRRLLLAIGGFFFHSLFVITKATSVALITSVAFLCELLIDYCFPDWPKWWVSIGVALASAYSLDKQVDIAGKFIFWRVAMWQTITLTNHWKLVIDQIEAVMEFQRKTKRERE